MKRPLRWHHDSLRRACGRRLSSPPEECMKRFPPRWRSLNLARLTYRTDDGISEPHRYAPHIRGGIKRRTACEKTIRQMIAQEQVGCRLGFQCCDCRNQVGGHCGFIITPLVSACERRSPITRAVRRKVG